MSLTATQLERLNKVAVQMLDPLVADASSPAGEQARHQTISDRLNACAAVAADLHLKGFSHAARLIAQANSNSANESATGSAPNRLEQTEAWIELAVAFCAGQLHGSAAAALESLHPALAELSPDFPSLGQQLQEEAARLVQAQQQREQDSLVAPEVGSDELTMLAQACAELEQELTVFANKPGKAPPDLLIAERIGYLSNAVRYMGLEVLANLFDHLIGQLAKMNDQGQALDARHEQALMDWPVSWGKWFQTRDPAHLEAGLALHADFDWAAPQLVGQTRHVLSRLQLVETRRDDSVAAGNTNDLDLADLSLTIPGDTDQQVIENLLQELPHLSGEFTHAIAGVSAGKFDKVPDALRVAHTIKGVANTVGIVGIANLTHALEDLLQLSVQSGRQPDAGVTETLCEAADCLAEMTESVGGLGAVPPNALPVYRRVLHCVNQLADEQESATGSTLAPDTELADDPGDAGFAEALSDTLDDGRIPLPEISLADFDLPDLNLDSPPTDSGDLLLPSGQPNKAGSTASVDEASGLQFKVPVLGEPDDTAWTSWGGPAETVDPVNEAEAGLNGPDESAELELEAAPSNATLRVNTGVIDRLLESSDEAVVAVSELQEAIGDVEAAQRAMRADSERLDQLSVELDRLIDAGGLTAGLPGAVDVNGGQLDALEMERFTELHTVSRRITEVAADSKVIEQQIERQLDRVHLLVDKLDRVQSLIREGVLRARMVEAASIAPRLQRAVRQAARVAGKEISLSFRGGDSAVDGQTLQLLVDPLAHLVRNAVDHGIESSSVRESAGKAAIGEITVTFEREVSGFTVIVEDDGAGLDMKAVEQRARDMGLLPEESAFDARAAAQLILAPGFTTRSSPSQLSGRGIGLDVVNQTVRGLHGVISVHSEAQAGTRFELNLPLQLASLSAFVLRAETHVLALSVRGIEKILLDADAVLRDDTGSSIAWQGSRLPLRRLDEVLGLPAGMLGEDASAGQRHDVILVVKQPAGEPGAVLVPDPGQAREVVVRGLPEFLPRVPGIDGVTILGDGTVAPVVDLPEMLAATAGARPDPRRLGRVSQPMPVCLVVDDSVSVRRAMAHFMLDLGLVCETASDGHEALQMISRHVPDIVVIDLEMPRINGLQLTQALRHDDRTAKLPIIMITSRHSEKHRAMAMAAGVTVFMTKPYTEDQLASVVGSCLAG